MSEPIGPTCVVCLHRRPYLPPVCGGCRTRLGHQLRELPNLYALLPTALIPTPNPGQRISGTPEHPLPISVSVVDMLAAARQPNPTEQGRRWPEDQTGLLSVASTLDQWVRDWRDLRNKRERLPNPTVAALTRWLDVRLEWACDHHKAIDEFALELRHTMTAMRTALALRRHIDRLQAPCPTCDVRALYREVDPDKGADDYISCGNCDRLWTEIEYVRLAAILVDEERRAA